MKTHDLRDLTMSDAYDKTQTSDEIRDGDILLVRDGVAIMVEAWPVMAEGISAVFHNVSHGFHAETSEKYAAAFAAAAALKSTNQTKVMTTLNKYQRREVATIEKMQHFGANYVARALSMLHRAALKNSQKAEIMALATQYGVTDNPEFIV